MSSITRNTDPKMGPLDGVKADVKCVLTQFDRAGKGKGRKDDERVIKTQTNMPCTILCAYSAGTVSLSLRDVDLMVTVRLDELYGILKAASSAAEEFQKSMPPNTQTPNELEGVQ